MICSKSINTGRRTGGGKETRHEKNQLLHEDLDSIVTKRSKEAKVQIILNLPSTVIAKTLFPA